MDDTISGGFSSQLIPDSFPTGSTCCEIQLDRSKKSQEKRESPSNNVGIDDLFQTDQPTDRLEETCQNQTLIYLEK